MELPLELLPVISSDGTSLTKEFLKVVRCHGDNPRQFGGMRANSYIYSSPMPPGAGGGKLRVLHATRQMVS